MKKLLGTLIVTLAVSSTFAAEMKVGIVDMQKAIQTTAAGKKAKSELESEFNKKKKELEKREADLKKMGEDLEAKKAVLSEEALQKKQAEMQEEVMKYREIAGKSQMDIQKKEAELTKPILEKMRKSIDKVAKEKGYSLVLENSPMVLFATKEHDLTDEVIADFEKAK